MRSFIKDYWWVIFLGLGIPVAYAATHLSTGSYVEALMSNWLSTLIGLIVGIPIALAMYRWRSESEITAKEVKVLEVIDEELAYNHETVSKSWIGKSGFDRGAYLAGAFKDELWRAVSESGDLQAVRDVKLLEKLADAYFYIRLLRQLGEKLFSLHLTVPISTKSTMIDHINSRADTFGGMAEVAIEAARDAIRDTRTDSNNQIG